jgi:hypothetical protein
MNGLGKQHGRLFRMVHHALIAVADVHAHQLAVAPIKLALRRPEMMPLARATESDPPRGWADHLNSMAAPEFDHPSARHAGWQFLWSRSYPDVLAQKEFASGTIDGTLAKVEERRLRRSTVR